MASHPSASQQSARSPQSAPSAAAAADGAPTSFSSAAGLLCAWLWLQPMPGAAAAVDAPSLENPATPAKPARSTSAADAADSAAPAKAAVPAALAPVVVVARHSDADSSRLNGFTAAPLALTPLAVDTTGADELQERGATTLAAAIRALPAVGDNYNTFGYVEALQIRGFALDALLNYQRDGMTVSSHVPVALENKDRIEILKGSSGMLAGSSAPGGLVNFVLKQPTPQTLVQLDAKISESGSVLLHGDFGGRLGAAAALGYRINLAAEERRPQIDAAWSKRTLVSGFFDWRASAQTLVQLEFEHQQVRQISVPGYGLLDVGNTGVANTLPPPIDPHLNLNRQPWTQAFESNATTGSVRLLHDLGNNWELELRTGTQRSRTNDRIAFADGCSYVNSARNSALGNYYLYNGLCSNYNVDIYQYISDAERRNVNSSDAHLRGRFTALALDQELTVGMRSTRYSERYPPFQTYNFVGSVNVFAAAPLPADPTALTRNAPLDTDLDELYFFDVAHAATAWSTWLGARYTRIGQDSSLTDGSEATRLQQHLLTPWAALGYEPWVGGFIYAAAGSGIEVGNVPNHPAYLYTGTQLMFANAGQALPAQRSRQIELGFKQHAGASAWVEAALYRITKPFADNLALSNGMALQVAGARLERHQGLELSAESAVLPTLSLHASVSVLDARTTAALYPGWVGKPATNVAPLAAALQARATFTALPGLAWINRINYAGHKAVLPDGSVDLPSYWQWDGSLQYDYHAHGLQWTWRAGVDNLTGRNYWREAPTAPWGSIYLFPAQPRSARLGLSVRW